MCGRFALGVGADDLVNQTHQHYFAPPPQPSSPQAPADDHEQPQEEQQGSSSDNSTSTTSQHTVQWASFESKTQHRPRYNVAPTTKVPVLRRSPRDPATFEFDLLRWGLVPHWYATSPDAGLSTINAQCESVNEGTPAWRGPRESKRCVVLAQGFYEWLAKGKDKVPHFVKRKDGKLMAFAGLWDHCDYKGAHDPVTSYTILTVPVNKQLRFLHTRMPALLSTGAEIALWLSDRRWSPDVQRLVRPFEGELECYAVDKGVGKAGNESPDFVKPVAQKKGSLDSFFARQNASSTAASPSGLRPGVIAKGGTSASSAKPTPGSSTAKAPKEENAGDNDETKAPADSAAAAFNPDEDTPARLGAVAAELGAPAAPPRKAEGDEEGRKPVQGKGAGTKRPRSTGVEVLDLAGESDDDEPVRVGKRAKTESEADEEGEGGKGEGSKARTTADGEGNEALTDFFPVVGKEGPDP
ncbi:hypothetical protein DMC30DRAFT_419949 [Rhodotorula diobovata]|uniref:DUF159-domain-containing protein n=1 Tax=Rhodotorula diobovata TaxID=5288 RepID=A0A5C5FLX1_9BASI|nr:hypothetical protein DMC30DRAFT_419949 [Rhodotorula diobovata]